MINNASHFGALASVFLHGAGVMRPFKTIDETVNAVGTVQDDNHLAVTLAAATSYALIQSVQGTSDAAADFEWTYSYTGTATPRIGTSLLAPASTVANRLVTVFGTTVASGTTTAADFYYWAMGSVITTTAGTLTFQWSQQTSNATDTTVYAGGWMILIPMS